jgi:hypothetical protein
MIVENFNLIGIGTLNYINGVEEVRGRINLKDYNSYAVEYIKDYSNENTYYKFSLSEGESRTVRFLEKPFEVKIKELLEDQASFYVNGEETGLLGEGESEIINKEFIIIPASFYTENNTNYVKIATVYILSEQNWTAVCSSTQKPENETLCYIDAGSFEDRAYQFRLSAELDSGWIYGQQMKAVVASRMFGNWPVELDGFPKGMPNIDEKQEKLIVPHYMECIQSLAGKSGEKTGSSFMLMSKGVSSAANLTDSDSIISSISQIKSGAYSSSNATANAWCSGNSLYFFNPDASSGRINDSIDDSMPAIYPDKETGKDYLAMIYTWGYGAGLMDFEGNWLSRWNENNLVSSSFSIHNTANTGDDSLFSLRLDLDTEEISIRGFDKTGKALEDFPISAKKPEGNETLVLRTPQLLDAGGAKRIAIVTGSFNVDEETGDMKDLAFFLDIYDLSGNLVERTKLFNSSKKIWLETGMLASGDFDRDGNGEIAFAFGGITDVDLFYEDRYNINAYATYLNVLDSNGNIISNTMIKGYVIRKMILADLGQGLNIIGSFSDTWAVWINEQGNKIMAFDSLLRTTIDTPLENKNDLIQGLVAGDVDGDYEPEIVVNYRPRWYNGGDSGFQIFDRKGAFEKDIAISTTGQADDYWGYDPILADFDSDSILDIIQQSLHITNDNQLKTRFFILNLGTEYKKGELLWPMYLHDEQRTGISSPVCTDSDNGADYNVKATAKGAMPDRALTAKTDFCADADYLTEYICQEPPDYSGAVASLSYKCPYGCADGACRKNCTDYDVSAEYPDGKNPFVKADIAGLVMILPSARQENQTQKEEIVYQNRTDKCIRKGNQWFAREFYCDAGGFIRDEDIYCAEGCFNDACIKIPCTDSDASSDYPDGKNPFVRGYVDGYVISSGGLIRERQIDKCVQKGNQWFVRERYCNATGFIQDEDIYCSKSCSSDACVK